MTSIGRFQRLEDLALPLALIVQAGLLFYHLELLPVWGDEQFTLNVVRLPWAEIPAVLQADIHPPVYYLLAKSWTLIPWPWELITQLRAFSAGICLVSTVVVYRLWLDEAEYSTCYWFLALWAISPTLLMYSRMARSYSLQLLVATIAFYCAARFLESPRNRRKLASYVIAAAALLYTHYLPGIAVAAATGFLLLLTAIRTKDRTLIRPLLLSNLGIALFYAPWIPTLVSAVGRVPGADPYYLLSGFLLETVVKLAYLFMSFNFGEAFPLWSITLGAILGSGLLWLLWKGLRERPPWLTHIAIVALIAYLGAAAWVAFPFIGARLLFLLPLYLLWLLTGRARTPIAGSVICAGMLVVSLGSLSAYYGKANFLNQGYLVPFDEIAAVITAEPASADIIVLIDGYNTDPAPLLVSLEGKLPLVRIRDDASQAEARAAIEGGNFRKVWFLRNAHDISPGGVLTQLEAAAAERYESAKHHYVPFSPMDQWVASRLGRAEATHHYQMTEFSRREAVP